MKASGVRKFFFYAGNVLAAIGTLLLFGSVFVWWVGPELFAELYEKSKPVLPFLLAGLGFLVLGILLASVMQDSQSAARAGPGGTKRRCGKCEALNDGAARFCNQCGTAL
jgi:hypothetical protein